MALLRSVLDHAILPPNIPGKREQNCEAISNDLLQRLLRACNQAEHLASQPYSDALRSLSESLQACRVLNQGRLDRETILQHFAQIKPQNVLILHVIEQNAAILVRREIDKNGEDSVVIESFETSPATENVLAADNALLWDFPGRAVRLTLSEFNDEKFQEQLAAFLEQASMESIHSLQAQARKAKVVVSEIRDTSDPALITQMLMAILEAIGDFATVPVLRKRVRDDVNLLESGSLPWRRLPFWLVLRVAAQRQLNISLGENGRACYKLLMSIFFADLLQDASKAIATKSESAFINEVKNLEPELVVTLRTKLCRRMIKIEQERLNLLTHKEAFESFFNSVIPVIRSSIEFANNCVENLWNDFKEMTKRSVKRLPQRASENSLCLSLLNSGRYLDKLLAGHRLPPEFLSNVSLHLPNPLDEPIQEVHVFVNQICRLSQMEQRIELGNRDSWSTIQDSESRCQTLADEIHNVFEQISKTYDGDPMLQSIKVLAIFELWMRMDESAIRYCPLLGDYRPVFTPGLLDVLQLPTLSDMERLLAIQNYLANRHAKAQYGHIFSALDAANFAVKYVKQSVQMKKEMAHIKQASNEDREAKTAEWQGKTLEYEEHTQQLQNLACMCTFINGVRVIHGCKKCWHWRSRNRLQVKHHEDFLPKEEAKSLQIVFELTIPKYLSAYRNATWKMLRDLAHPARSYSKAPYTTLDKCPQLKIFMEANSKCISLASEKKCFTETHYSFSDGLVPLYKIMLPFAADFQLYDQEAKIWVKDLAEVPTLHHLCGIHIPMGLSSTVLMPQQHPVENFDGPSSYAIQANITKCPPTLSVAEFSAYQKLLVGKSRRWLNILVELGSSNLNFSNEDTSLMISQLAVQAGPRSPKDSDALRSVHSVMQEREFVQSLKEQIKSRIDSVYTNWRETGCMELLINLSLRIFSLLPDGEMRREFELLLKSARAATLEWIAPSQEESRKAQDRKDADRISTYGLKAALLCRRTFEMYVGSEAALLPSDLSAWIRASVALQESRVMSISSLPNLVKNMMIRDAKMMYCMSSLIRTAAKNHSGVIGEAIGIDWQSVTRNVAQPKASWMFFRSPHEKWIRYVAHEDHERFQGKQVFWLHILEGHFLVNGKRRGSLPLAIRNDPSVKLLFEDHNLYVYPSTMPGMEYQLAHLFEDQVVHFGMRDSKVIIRAQTRSALYEFIPNTFFGINNPMTFDLPMSLIDSCSHWLNLDAGILEVRRQPSIWFSRTRDWSIDVFNRWATRGGKVKLVDPRSSVFGQIARVFQHFEKPQKLTVFQSELQRSKLSVELRHLDLEFRVNNIGLLFCKQLKASIDLDQDAGTWYGLASKIVLRDMQDREKRSIIIPNGKLTWRRHHSGIHVSSFLEDSDGYSRFDIDETLGRLSAPAEPLLLYKKALCHAITSFCLPDPLTGVTGTEEAIRILQSGAAQPWSPNSSPNLEELASLLPQREYYPLDLKRLQRVKWNDSLTTTIQNDRFETIIRKIEERATRLAKFSEETQVQTKPVRQETQLRLRAQARRLLYERAMEDTANLHQSDKAYIPRDRQLSGKGHRVFQVAEMIHSCSPHIEMKRSLRETLECWDYIDGFNDGSLLGAEPLMNQIENPINMRWGSLINICRDKGDKLLSIFQLGLASFHSKVDMDVVKILVAFCCIKELGDLERPVHTGFSRFADRGPPSVEILQQFIAKAFLPCPASSSKAKQREKQMANHKSGCENQGKLFAEVLLKRWPVLPSSIGSDDTLAPSLIDVPLALSTIRPDWDRRVQNDQLSAYVEQADAILLQYNGLVCPSKGPQEWQMGVSRLPTFSYQDIVPSISQDLVSKAGPELVRTESHFKIIEVESHSEEAQEASPEHTELGRILDSFSGSPNTLRQNYSDDLLRSLTALKQSGNITRADSMQSTPEVKEIIYTIEQMQATAAIYLESIKNALWSGDARFKWLTLGDILPCRTPIETLELLQSRANHQFGAGMKEALIHYGCAVAEVQRLRRLRSAVLRNDQRAINEELSNVGHENWDPAQEDPDWLLLEIDSNILIRTDQVDVARAIISPPSGENSVLQMNMGRDNKPKEAVTMINFQKWLDVHCRDILDESDFTLSPKTQLNYPSGSEKTVDGHRFRWEVAEGLLSMVSDYVPRLQADFPGSIEILARSSWLPTVQFLRTDVEDELHRLIVEDVSDGKAPFLHREGTIDEDTRMAIKWTLSEQSFDRRLFEKAINSFSHPESAAIKLLTVRGLVTRKILVLCLAKRWNVQYGLHPRRPPVAVPYAAKGIPSELSEYGHPDVAIVLTCLSFYSAGLSYEQFRQGLKRVLTSEDAASEYEKWTSESVLPPSLQHWNLINVDDESQMRSLWKHLYRSQVVADYYMNNFVFPLHARQFTIKLQASAWDIPLNTKTTTALNARTTGFSGTNDNRYLLPMTIQQDDLPSLLQTNAEVLSYLLQPRNREYAVLVDRNRRRLSEKEMLTELWKQEIRILIDAGAYILEMGNKELVDLWLSIDKHAQAAVYFRSDNSAWVSFRDPAKQDAPLLATRLANDLKDCVVYFDEAHTRGVDLKLPEDSHAALTLALKQTKDNTMQAAMRLRQLRTTQSVTFFAPPEVDMSIKDICGKRFPIKDRIESPHVIFWLLEQSCKANEDLQPLFQAQGNDFCRRANAMLKYPKFLSSEPCKSGLVEVLQQQEHQTLEQLYGGSLTGSSQGPEKMLSSRLRQFVERLSQHDNTGAWKIDAFGEVEQERELEVQLETVREVQRPIRYAALAFPGLDLRIFGFLSTGELDIAGGGISHAFDYIAETEVGKKHGIRSTGSRLFVSKEFGRTIVLSQKNRNVGDRFLRPVEWILWSPSTQTALIIIPEEVELLIPMLRFDDGKPKVHLIAYAAPITRAMTPFNQLRYYSLPPISLEAKFPTWFKVELGLVAGRLYTDYEEWKLVGDYMRSSQAGTLISTAFLLEWLAVRCRAHDVLHTPMGYVCLGRTVTENHPFFVRNTPVVAPVLTAVRADDVVEKIEDEDWETEDEDWGEDVNDEE
ncbi:hypothetical protein ACHAQJ_004638 [Trichoderma viride]